MDIETRVKNLEDMLASIVVSISNNKFYTDADIAGVRQNVSDVTPFTAIKNAYIDDTEVIFDEVPYGKISVFISDPSIDNFETAREGDKVIISFSKPLEEVVEVTLSIL